MGFESNFQSSALEYLNGLPGCVAENVSGNSHQSGRPDINGCYKGRMFKLELKTPDNKYQASKKQLLHLRRWNRAGAVTGVIYSLGALRKLMEEDWNCPIEILGAVTEDNNCESIYRIPAKQ